MKTYRCDRCGACCSSYPFIEADAIDVIREPRITESATELSGRGRLPLIESDWMLNDSGRCVFLNGEIGRETSCGIYVTRPNSCVSFLAGEQDCQGVRRDAGLPALGPIDADTPSIADRIIAEVYEASLREADPSGDAPEET